MRLLSLKTRECDELADDRRLAHAEQTLAQRYEEVKEIAEMAYRLGLGPGDAEAIGDAEGAEGTKDGEDLAAIEAETEATAQEVARLESQLENCVSAYRTIEASSSEQVARHPAYMKMKGDVQAQLVNLQSQLETARGRYAELQGHLEAAQQEQEGEQSDLDLEPLMQAALNKLWARPYKCRVFTLKLLSSLAELDDDSLMMTSSCFAKYLDDNAVPVR